MNNKKKQIYFDLILLLVDNLGLHSILALVESFSSNMLCDFCLTEHKNLYTIFNEPDCILHNERNFNALLSQNNVLIFQMKEPFVSNQLDNSHIVKNLTVDTQHDILEGVLRYDLPLGLFHFIFIAKYFTLADLNLRLAGYK